MGQQLNKLAKGFWTLHHHDARNLEKLFESHPKGQSSLVTATITSPPYGGLKDYGHDDQIGFGQSYGDYLVDMEKVFRQIYQRTAEDGSLWLIADTYMSKGSAPRALLPVPFDLSRAAEAAGFTLRDVIIWQKDRTLPWSNGTRLRNAFEYVLLLVKGAKPKYRIDRLREHLDLKEWWVRFPERYNPKGKAPSNVWEIPIPMQGSWGNGEIAHACPLPPVLVERLILLSSDDGDVILDPFAGSGVVVAEAERLNRLGLGTELVERNVDEFTRIIRPEILKRRDPIDGSGNGGAANADLLIKLRMLKLPIVLMRRAARRREEIAWPLGALVLPGRARRTNGNYAAAKMTFIVRKGTAEQRKNYATTLREFANRAPASKFGIDTEIDVADLSMLKSLVAGRRIFSYRNGSTSRATGSIPHKNLEEVLALAEDDSTPPVLSSIFVDVAPRPEADLTDNGSAWVAQDSDP
jgi:DNA modification methylase